MQCAYCARPIRSRNAWKSSSNHFYCSEFCADSETADVTPAVASIRHQDLAQRYERLQRMLQYKPRSNHPAARTAP